MTPMWVRDAGEWKLTDVVTAYSGAPRIEAVGIVTAVDPDCSGQDWHVTASWTMALSDDTQYKLTVEKATNAGGTEWANWLTDATTYTDNEVDSTGKQGLVDGTSNPVTSYRRYRMTVIRRSDSAVIQTVSTTVVQVVTGDCL